LLKLEHQMDLKPPPGSKITLTTTDGAEPAILIPNSGGAMRYLTALFLLFWLGMWTMGFRDAGSRILSGSGGPFLVFWLCAWTIGGIFAVLSLYRMVRPAVPESLTLKRNSVTYDSGIPPMQFNTFSRNRSPRDAWNALFPTRIRADFDKRQLQTLRLRETDSGNRLTIDADAERLDIAKSASELEREWLLRLLAQRYSLPQTSGVPAASN
jgi:hypothetical protein